MRYVLESDTSQKTEKRSKLFQSRDWFCANTGQNRLNTPLQLRSRATHGLRTESQPFHCRETRLCLWLTRPLKLAEMILNFVRHVRPLRESISPGRRADHCDEILPRHSQANRCALWSVQWIHPSPVSVDWRTEWTMVMDRVIRQAIFLLRHTG